MDRREVLLHNDNLGLLTLLPITFSTLWAARSLKCRPPRPAQCSHRASRPQSSGAAGESRWLSWAPVPNKPTVSVDVKQHFNQSAVRHLFAVPLPPLPPPPHSPHGPITERRRITTVIMGVPAPRELPAISLMVCESGQIGFALGVARKFKSIYG